jgi:hypothetical protein
LMLLVKFLMALEIKVQLNEKCAVRMVMQCQCLFLCEINLYNIKIEGFRSQR